MDDVAIGRAMRAVRIKKGLRQADVARLARTSQQTVSRLEAGRVDTASVAVVRRVAGVLSARIVLDFRWQGGELDRLLGARHSAMHEAIAELFAGLPAWVTQPEVSFAIFGERGVIDILAWHEATRSLLVIELKTELTDLQETLGTLDRKVRLAPAIVRDRGWIPRSVSAWLVVAEGSTNRERVAAHRAMLRAALAEDGTRIHAWLRRPDGRVRALSFLAAGAARSLAQPRRVHGRSKHVGAA